MKGEKSREPKWIGWLREQVRLGADMGAAVEALRHNGVADPSIASALEMLRPLGDALSSGTLQPPPLIRRAPPNLRRIELPKLHLYLYDGFLSGKECERLNALISHHLQPSGLSRDGYDSDFRTSTTCLLAHLRSPVAVALDAKICKTIGIRAEYGEGIQAQRYDVGQQFKPHLDCFPPGSSEFRRYAALRGNRSWTFMVYLNEGMEGGGTRFTELDYTVQPRTGMALFWNNLYDDGLPNPASRHSGEPVIRGHKVIITKWFRTRGDGPVFQQ
ncbi:MAG TPA: 2OG-Fe(II) oxygenase [Steroidobacteraceae bacterium]|nr:2OG-Fe(II) oxygenase [Steroidobacteraceae bacterium]